MAPSRSLRCSKFRNQRALSVFSKVRNTVDIASGVTCALSPLTPITSAARRCRSLNDKAFSPTDILADIEAPTSDSQKTDTVLYLAYGSNLSAGTFRGVRGIQPLSQINVLVPELQLSFDLPGIPYNEPCFANTRYRSDAGGDKPAIGNGYHKDRWHKGLVGVVYEVTKADYVTIITTEGSSSAYQDVVVECFEIPAGTKITDPNPSTSSFKAHTLYAPYEAPSEPRLPPGSGRGRPDPSYAQASSRYLKLITDGAEEHDLPQDYRDFLYDLRPYSVTSSRQKMGQTIFLTTWMPFILAIFIWSRQLADKKGRAPAWLATLSGWIFAAMWASYDAVFKPIFGDGERTEQREDEGERSEAGKSVPLEKQPLIEGSPRGDR
ncbi:MAG: hypothetical protein M1818_001263 [Claussenomyces sp. TS43310]|nr:MAG: hypothetical protein M1818_001263 [Claussenomyces sp. TS43310]